MEEDGSGDRLHLGGGSVCLIGVFWIWFVSEMSWMIPTVHVVWSTGMEMLV